MNILTRKLNGKNPDWTGDRKNYNQVSPLKENLNKKYVKMYNQSTSKLQPRKTEKGGHV